MKGEEWEKYFRSLTNDERSTLDSALTTICEDFPTIKTEFTGLEFVRHINHMVVMEGVKTQ